MRNGMADNEFGSLVGTSRREAPVIVIKGAGEKASAVAHRLYRAGWTRILMTERAKPRAERRGVSFCEAVFEGRKNVEGVTAELVSAPDGSLEDIWSRGGLAVMVDPGAAVCELLRPEVFIDGVMAKRNTGATRDMARLVVALGPGFRPGVDADAVIETNPASDRLGEVLWTGGPEADTSVPTPVAGLTHQRLLIAGAEGKLQGLKDIGQPVTPGQVVATVDGRPIRTAVNGVVWGLMRSGVHVRPGTKVGDIDPRGTGAAPFLITPQSRRIAAGVLEALLAWRGQAATSGRAARWPSPSPSARPF